MLCGHVAITLQRCDQALLVRIPLRPDEIPRQTHAQTLGMSGARDSRGRARLLPHQMHPNGPVRDGSRLHVGKISRRLLERPSLLHHVHNVTLAFQAQQLGGRGWAHAGDAPARAAPRPMQPHVRRHVAGLASVEAAPRRRVATRESGLHRLREPRPRGSRSPDAQDARPRRQLAPVRPCALVPRLQGAALHRLDVLGATLSLKHLVLQQLAELRKALLALRYTPRSGRAHARALSLLEHSSARDRPLGLRRGHLQPLPPRGNIVVCEIRISTLANKLLLALRAQEIRSQGKEHAAVHDGAAVGASRCCRRIPLPPSGLCQLARPPDGTAVGSVQRRQERHAAGRGSAVGSQRHAPAHRLGAAAHEDLALHAVSLELVQQVLPLLPGITQERSRHRCPADQLGILPAQAADRLGPCLVVLRGACLSPKSNLHQAQQICHRVRSRLRRCRRR